MRKDKHRRALVGFVKRKKEKQTRKRGEIPSIACFSRKRGG
jgi:hypothetical protein